MLPAVAGMKDLKYNTQLYSVEMESGELFVQAGLESQLPKQLGLQV
jgi:hypothetical protein